MSPGLADVPRNADSRIPSPKNTFDRDPLLIPQLFVNGKPWYRRRGTWVKIILSAIVVIGLGFTVHHFTAVALLRKFAKIANFK